MSFIEGLQRGQCGLYQDSTVSFRKSASTETFVLIAQIQNAELLNETSFCSVLVALSMKNICLKIKLDQLLYFLQIAGLSHDLSCVSCEKKISLNSHLSWRGPPKTCCNFCNALDRITTTYFRNNFLTRCQSFDSARLAGVPAAA